MTIDCLESQLPPGFSNNYKLDLSRLVRARAGGAGSGVWTAEELKDIRATGRFPADAEWHHNPTLANRPDLAGDPSIVRPVRGGRRGHLKEHGGDWRKPYPEDEK